MESEAIQWLELATLDHNVAKHLFDTNYPRPIEIICYHCQIPDGQKKGDYNEWTNTTNK